MDDLIPPLLDWYYVKKGWATLNLGAMSMQDGMVMERLLHGDADQQEAMISSIEDKLRQAEEY